MVNNINKMQRETANQEVGFYSSVRMKEQPKFILIYYMIKGYTFPPITTWAMFGNTVVKVFFYRLSKKSMDEVQMIHY